LAGCIRQELYSEYRKCFDLISSIEKEKEKYYSYNSQAFDSYVTNVEPVLTDETSLRQDIQRTIQEADVKLALYQLSSSLTTYKKFLDLIRMLNEQNKKIMNISDEELSAIFKGGSIRTF
jgi:hypothetical protein